MFRAILVVAGLAAALMGCADRAQDTVSVGDFFEEVPIEAEAFGLQSLGENITEADVIARVTLDTVSKTVEGVRTPTEYVSAMAFTFDVEEYLKGTGGDQLTAMVIDLDNWYSTAEEARAGQGALLKQRDTRWDEREAVVFLRKHDRIARKTLTEADRYFLGYIHFYDEPDGYTVASGNFKMWLPEATGGSAGRSTRSATSTPSTTQKRYLLDDPFPAGGAVTYRASNPTITLGALNSKIASIAAEITAGDGTDAYRDCVLAKYSGDRLTSEGSYGGYEAAYSMISGTIGGDPVGFFTGMGMEPDTYGQYWVDGQDKDLFWVKHHDKRTGPGNGFFWHRADAFPVRPLPAGTYSIA